jgi:hypothetical protein
MIIASGAKSGGMIIASRAKSGGTIIISRAKSGDNITTFGSTNYDHTTSLLAYPEYDISKCWHRLKTPLDYLTTHTSLSPIRRGFAPGFVNCQKW